jgi:hypothetical protein
MFKPTPNNRNITIICISLVVVLVAAGSFLIWQSRSVPEAEVPGLSPLEIPDRNGIAPEVPVMRTYPTKIIYTTDIPSPKEQYVNDCSTRGGVFNSCGNSCEPGAEVCASVCAYTCTLE